MSDTPRTEAEMGRLKGPTDDIVTVDANFACELERELNRACEMYRKLDIHTLNLVDRIRRLEEAGDELRECASRIGTVASGEGSVIRRSQEAIQAWDKEVKL